MQIFPESLSIIWSLWEIRGMVLLSLILQGVLILNGNRRKYSCSKWLRFLWLAYLSADWVATVSLSVLSGNTSSADNATNKSTDPDNIITAFWAPFLLLHLGGPDTITAYSMEDNELWWRHLLVLVVQVSLAFYVFLRAWSGHALNFLAIPMFVAGIIKFAERTWVLRSASSRHFRQSMFPRPDAGPNYARYMDEYRSKEDEGFNVKVVNVMELAPTIGDYSITAPSNIPHAADLRHAHLFFQVFKRLFADLILSIHDIRNSRSFFRNISCDEAFRVIEIELGFMYDLFYTKAALYTVKAGAIIRFISSVCIIYVSVSFLTISKKEFKEANVIITYTLLAGAIILKVYAVFRLLRSDWTMLWLTKHKTAEDLLYPIISYIPLTGEKRWSNVITKYNFIRFCLQEKPAKYSRCLPKVPWRHNTYKIAEEVPRELKELIYQQLIKKSRTENRKEVCAYRARQVLEKEGESCHKELGWSLGDEFDESVLLWHIATHLCYYSDLKKYSKSFSVPTDSDPEDDSNSFCHPKCDSFFGKGPKCNSDLEKFSNSFRDQNCEASKLISEYMLYLLVKCPFMLPNGIGEIRFQDTYAEAIEFFEQRNCKGDTKACEELLAVNTNIDPAEVKGDKSKSVLFHACRLAKLLQSLETEQNWENQKKWELISHVWIEKLFYAATQCRWNHHAQQLTRGGQLLTHVWLLMAHLGITQQIQTFKIEMAKIEHS